MSKPRISTAAKSAEISAQQLRVAVPALGVDDCNEIKDLPRLLRYVVLDDRTNSLAVERLIAEFVELAPDVPLVFAWANDLEAKTGLSLARELDRCALIGDRPDLRSLADCVRLNA